MIKLYEQIKRFIKEYYKVIIIYFILICLFTVNLPYYISAPGGLLNTKDKIKTDNSFKMTGSLNMAYVTEIHASIPTYLWSFIAKDWDLEKEKDIVANGETSEDMNYRNKMLLKESNNIAELVAYEHSNIDYSIRNNKVYVTYIDEQARTNLKVGDKLIEIDNNKIIDKNYLYSYIASKKIGDKVFLKVIRDGKKIEKEANLIDVNKEPKIGIVITENFDIKSDRKIKFNFSNSESGPSGGLMLALTIYSNLNRIDLTNGKKIAGTGTIDRFGKVGEISGIKYKLIGAVNNNADVFLVPKGDNYKEAKKIKGERDYNIDIIPIETFEDALKYLNSQR